MKFFVSFWISVLLFWQIIADEDSQSSDSTSSPDGSSNSLPAGAGGIGNNVSLPTNLTIGGVNEIPFDNYPEVISYLNVSLPMLYTGYSSPMQVVNVTKITKQIVSGMIYDITGTFSIGNLTMNCEVWLWYRGWLKDMAEKYKIKGLCQNQTQTWRPANSTETW